MCSWESAHEEGGREGVCVCYRERGGGRERGREGGRKRERERERENEILNKIATLSNGSATNWMG